MNVAVKLKESRVNAGYTQLEVKKKTGINNKSLSNWEKGVSSPSLPDLVVLAKLYDVSTDYLLGNDDTPPSKVVPIKPAKTAPIITDAEIELIIKIRNSSKQTQKLVNILIDSDDSQDETPDSEPPKLKVAM